MMRSTLRPDSPGRLRTTKNNTVALFAALLLTTLAAALRADDVDDYLEAERKEHDIPGLALLVIEGGEVTKMSGYGSANLEHQAPVTSKTIFQSGSVGKMFTAAGILLLAEDGKLSLDDRLAAHFPTAPSSWHRMTVRHLLSHTSGLHDYELVSKGDGSGGDTLDLRRDYSEDELLAAMMRQPLDFEPGTQWSYSNSGYVVAGILISKLTEKHWSEFLADRVLGPAGMKTTSAISERRIVPHRSGGYQKNEEGQLVNQNWISHTWGTTGDGALYFSLEDLAAWEATLRERHVLGADSYEEWWTPITLAGGGTHPYGLGWSVHEQRGRRLIEHGGAWQGFRAHFSRYVEDDLTIALLANAGHANPGDMVHHIAGLLDEDLRLPDPESPSEPNAQQLEEAKTAHEILEAWSKWQKHPAMCSTMSATAAGSPRSAWSRRALGRRLAQAKELAWLAEDDIGGDELHLYGETIRRISYFALETEDSRYRYRFHYSSKGCVAGFGTG